MSTIYTSSWSTKLPNHIKRIGVSRGTPRGQPAEYRLFKTLAPGPWFNSVSTDKYVTLYKEHLTSLDPRDIYAGIEDRAAGGDCALLCFEAPEDDEAFCHRGLISAWFYNELGLIVKEWGMEQMGYGPAHPKIPANHRATEPR